VRTIGKDTISITCPAWGAEVTAPADGQCEIGQKVAVAIRPEKITIAKKRPAGVINVARGKVHDLGYFGKDSLYRIALADGTLVRVNRVNDRRAGENERVADWEDDVWLSFDPASAIVLSE
jgi:putrescine transport system ATP-binding protein